MTSPPRASRRASLLPAAVFLAGISACSPPAEWRSPESGARGRAPARPALVAAAGDLEGFTEVLVDARVPRTSIGHFRAGDEVRLRVLDGLWTYAPGAELIGPEGLATACSAPAPHVCAAGEGAAPGMGLLLFAKTDPHPPACSPSHRFFIPSGVEFAMPEEAFLFLAPNDWEDGVENNLGAIDVMVETAVNRTSPALTQRKLTVPANAARTPLGRLSAGVHLRVSVLGGTWNNDPGAPRVPSEGVTGQPCRGDGAHTCPAGEGRAPLMGLTLLMASCEDGGMPSTVPDTKTFIGGGADIRMESDGELLLGPNDWEDGCHDNSGFMKVGVSASGR